MEHVQLRDDDHYDWYQSNASSDVVVSKKKWPDVDHDHDREHPFFQTQTFTGPSLADILSLYSSPPLSIYR